MAEELYIPHNLPKEEAYRQLFPQIKALITPETDMIANLSNIMAALKQTMNFFWVGCYFVKENELILGPFQGPVACTRIAYGKGVCGTCWKNKKPIVVDDVSTFPGHIACNAASKSELVIPVFNTRGDVFLVLDVDSDKINDFDAIDVKWLTKILQLMENKLTANAKG